MMATAMVKTFRFVVILLSNGKNCPEERFCSPGHWVGYLTAGQSAFPSS